MQVRPECHQRQPIPGRRASAIGRRHQQADPRHHDGQRQDMRTRQDVMQRQQQRQHREQHRARCADLRVEQVDEDRGRECDPDRGEDHGTGPVPLRMGEGEHHLRQPRRRDPGLTGPREGIEVRIGKGSVIEDPLPDLDLPERVGVLKQRVADKEEEEIGAGADAQRHQCARAALHRDAVGKGKGHAASSSCLFLSGWPGIGPRAVITSSKSRPRGIAAASYDLTDCFQFSFTIVEYVQSAPCFRSRINCGAILCLYVRFHGWAALGSRRPNHL